MPLDALAVETHVGAEHLAAQQIVNDERSDIALTTTRVLGRPAIAFFGRVETPRLAYRLFQLRESEHGSTVPLSAPALQHAGERNTPAVDDAARIRTGSPRASRRSRLPTD